MNEITAHHVEKCEPHCIAWARATASLWGMSSTHDLDEPVRLTNETPVRLRLQYEGRRILLDRQVSLTTERAGTHVAMRFYFRDGSFHEQELVNITLLRHGDNAVIGRD